MEYQEFMDEVRRFLNFLANYRGKLPEIVQMKATGLLIALKKLESPKG